MKNEEKQKSSTKEQKIEPVDMSDNVIKIF